jgi:assimilatory nitrate reductase catalytic subunit
MTPIARTADLFIPVRSGGDIGVFYGMLHVMVQRGWINREFIAAHTTGWDAVEAIVERYTPEVRRPRSPACPASMIVRAAEMWGPAETASCCTPAASSTTRRASRTAWPAINLVVATGASARRAAATR